MIYAIPYLIYILFLGFLAILYHQRRSDEEFCRNIIIYCALSFIFFFGFVCIGLVLLSFGIKLSIQEQMITKLAQEIAILKKDELDGKND